MLEDLHGQPHALPTSERSALNLAPGGGRESLLRSTAQIAAGESVKLLPVLDRLRASAERLEGALSVGADGDRTPTKQR